MAAEQSLAGKTALTDNPGHTGNFKRVHRVKEHEAMLSSHGTWRDLEVMVSIDRVIVSSGSLPSLKERVSQKENSNEKKIEEGER